MRFLCFVFCFLVLASVCECNEEKEKFSPFGEIHIYTPVAVPASNLMIMISGDGGWHRTVVELAQTMAEQNYLVVGIDITQYLRSVDATRQACSSPAADLERLTAEIAEKYGVARDDKPILIGYSSGATLAYATLVEDPASFRAAFSFGFCPDLEIRKPLCQDNGLQWDPTPRGDGFLFRPARGLSNSWVVFQGIGDKVCKAENTQAFVDQVPSAQLVLLPGVGHGYLVFRNWFPQFEQILTRFESVGQNNTKQKESMQ